MENRKKFRTINSLSLGWLYSASQRGYSSSLFYDGDIVYCGKDKKYMIARRMYDKDGRPVIFVNSLPVTVTMNRHTRAIIQCLEDEGEKYFEIPFYRPWMSYDVRQCVDMNSLPLIMANMKKYYSRSLGSDENRSNEIDEICQLFSIEV